MIIWINGTFGAGKTTTARLLASQSDRVRLFDPEWVGYLLRANLQDHPVADFQQWPSWRVLTPLVADEIARFSGQHLVAPQTVLDEDYRLELMDGLATRGHQVLHVVLEAETPALVDRIRADEEEAAARQWRLDHLTAYEGARPWLARRADLMLDTTHRAPQEVADLVWTAAHEQLDELGQVGSEA